MTGIEIRDTALRFVKRRFWPITFVWVSLVAAMAASQASELIESGLRGANPFVLPPPPPAKPSARANSGFRPQSDYAVISERNLFNKNPLPKFGERPDTEIKPSGPAVATKLQVSLLGTVVSETPSQSLALIVDKSDPTALEAYRIGEKVLEVAEVVEIKPGEVTLLNRGQRETLSLEDSSLGGGPVVKGGGAAADLARNRLEERREQMRRAQDRTKRLNEARPPNLEDAEEEELSADDSAVVEVEEGNFEIDSSYMEETLENIGQLMTQARVVPNMVMGQIKGYKIFAIKPNSLYMRLGLKNGDIIERINGIEIKTPDKALGLLQELRYERNFELDYVRQGQKITNTYTVR